jgi:hypothetical protein
MPFLQNEINTALTPFFLFALSPEWEREGKGEGNASLSSGGDVSLYKGRDRGILAAVNTVSLLHLPCYCYTG